MVQISFLWKYFILNALRVWRRSAWTIHELSGNEGSPCCSSEETKSLPLYAAAGQQGTVQTFIHCLSLSLFLLSLTLPLFVGLGFVSSLAPWQIQLSDNTLTQLLESSMSDGIGGTRQEKHRCVRYLSDNSIRYKLNGHCPRSTALDTQTSH